MYAITEYQYQQLRNYCKDAKDAVMDEIGRQPLKVELQTTAVQPNTGNPKLLDEMERFAVMCDRADNRKDARCVRSWVRQLSAMQ